jgi:AcrR family transcriptional regulator
VDDRLLDATVAVLAEYGHVGLTLERVAERVGRSRVTLWRQQVTPEALIDGLLARLTRDYRDAMWPAVTEAGTGAERLRSALDALCAVAEDHLPLLGASDDVFDRAAQRTRDITGQSFSFVDPFTAAVRAGLADGTLATALTPAEDAGARCTPPSAGATHCAGAWLAGGAPSPPLDLAMASLRPRRTVTSHAAPGRIRRLGSWL